VTKHESGSCSFPEMTNFMWVLAVMISSSHTNYTEKQSENRPPCAPTDCPLLSRLPDDILLLNDKEKRKQIWNS